MKLNGVLAASVGLVALVAVGNPSVTQAIPTTDPHAPCACEEYLKAQEWWVLDKYYDIKFPDFCCGFSIWKLIFDFIYYIYYKGIGAIPKGQATVMGQLVDTMNIPVGQARTAADDDSANEMIKRMILEAAMKDGDVSVPSVKEGDIAGFGADTPGYSYQPKCYGLYGIEFIICTFLYYFDEATDACYCYYRGTLQCDPHDCNTTTFLTDLHVAEYRWSKLCNQCPGAHGDGSYGNQPPYGGSGYGGGSGRRPKQLEGSPYDECVGYCTMTYFFREFYYPYYYHYH